MRESHPSAEIVSCDFPRVCTSHAILPTDDHMTTDTKSAAQMDELETYREGVETLLLLGSNRAISNGEPAHAAVIFEMFFKHAKERVAIFCKNLNRAVFDNDALTHQAAWALTRGVMIDVIVQDENPDKSAFSDLLEKAKVKVRRAIGAAKSSPFNFAVMDKRAIRIESDRKKCEARAWMNAPETASTLSRSFEHLAHPAASPLFDPAMDGASHI